MAFGRHLDADLRSEGSPREHDNPRHAGIRSHLTHIESAADQLAFYGFPDQAEKIERRGKKRPNAHQKSLP